MATSDTERKVMRLTEQELEALKRLAEARDITASQQVRIWIEDFVKYGTSAPSKETKQFHMIMPRELAERAEAKAAEAGLTLRDVVRHEIGVVYRRP